jgi:tRNA(Ile)-lysidine synthase
VASLPARVRRTIETRQLFAGARGVLCAVSGGADSIAMLHALARLAPDLRVTLAVASIDHGLRPTSADEVALVRAAADALGLPFRTRRLDLGPSTGDLSARARAARYAALHDLARELGATRVAVGHTLDDQAETVLARLLRGSGVRGLAGIRPRRRDGVVRPLLDVRRAEARAYVRSIGAPFVDDPSNEDPRFSRSRMRHMVLPVLVAEAPDVAVHLARLADEARGVRSLVERRARRFAPGEPLPVARLRAAGTPVATEVLRRVARAATGRPPSRANLDALGALLDGPGEVWLAEDAVAVREGGVVRTERRGRRRTPQDH